MIQDCSNNMQSGNRNINSIEEQQGQVMHHGQLVLTDLQKQQHHLTFQTIQHEQHVPLQQIQQQQYSHVLQQQVQQQSQHQSQQVLWQHLQYLRNNTQLLSSQENIFMSFDENEVCSNTNESNEVGILGVANTSDAIEDSITENDIQHPDEAFSYLQGLNSGNLMQFSQQSALQELMKDEHSNDDRIEVKPEIDIKPNLDVLPTFEEHDIGGYKFQINVSNQRKGKSNWIYSETLNKVYIRMNEIFNVEASYTPKLPVQQLRIRALLCFVKEVSEPVLRCQNHMSVDTESNAQVRRSLLRCENPTAEYRGHAQGKSINDRFSILIPLNGSTKQGAANDTQKQTIAFKFTCQNSCIGRKETSVIFLLESLNGEILSQRVIDVKMCSCPKRDKAMDERNISQVTKRKVVEDLYPRKKKMLKKEAKSPFSTQMDTEEGTSEDTDHDENSSDSNPHKASQRKPTFELQSTASGRYRVVIEADTRGTLPFIDTGLRQAALDMATNPNNAYYKRLFRKIQKWQREISK